MNWGGFVFGAVAAQLPLVTVGLIFWPGAHGWDVGIPGLIAGFLGGLAGSAFMDFG